MTVLGGLQCGKDCVVLHDFLGFNTDDGIRRAAMDSRWDAMKAAKKVSIPMTVLGGLQSNGWGNTYLSFEFQYR